MTTPHTPSLFDDVNVDAPIDGMVHAGDPHTSRDAACVVARCRTALHGQVIEAFNQYGPMTDEALEQLPDFRGFGPSTIRKRRSELYQHRDLVAVGETKNSRGRKMTIWGLADIPKEIR